MKYSIRKQFTIIFTGMMVATVILCWLVNIFFLEGYYQREKQDNLREVYHTINKAVNDGTWNTTYFYNVTLSKLCNKYNISGIVADVKTQTLTTFGVNEKESQRQLWDSLLFIDRYKGDYLEETKEYKMMIFRDNISQSDYVQLWGNLDDGDVFFLRTALESIRESVAISNRFLAYVGIVSVLVSGIIIWILTRKYTEPIRELVSISEKMAHLDFNVKYRGEIENEIGILGENINFMSEKLENTISELKTANIELTRDIRNKERLEEMRTDFLSSVSHELKTPLALIQGYAEGLRDNISEDSEEREYYCDVIIDEAAKMNEIVKKLLLVNQLEFGNDLPKMERLNITAIIYGVVESGKKLLEQNNVKLKLPPGNAVYCWGDEFKIEEVFTNYFTNALHHVHKNISGEKEISINIIISDESVRVEVYNTGDLIPVESISRIWDKFYKVDKARTREYGGSGMGLSIVKAIMLSLHQKYGVENLTDGVLFWFELERA